METGLYDDKKIKKTKEPAGGAKVWQVIILMFISAALAAMLVIFVLLSGKTRYALVDTADEHDAGLISKLLNEIDKYYYFRDDAPSDGKLLDIAAHSVVNSLGDVYAAYMTEAEYNDFQNQMNGNYKGIGVLVSLAENKGLKVERSYEGNPAYAAGIRDGDIITEVDGNPLSALELDAASALLKGEDGSFAAVKVLRGEEALEFSVKRGDVAVKRVYAETLDDGIGYIRIESFTGSAVSEFDGALDKLLSGGAGSLIIDLRNNPGGSLDTVVKICDRILPACTVTTVEGKMSAAPEVYSSTDEESLSIPYVVLVNENSASASEIFASAVQDNKTGTIMGTTTFGKGIVQTSWSLDDGMGYLKLTTDVYKTPTGRLIHGVGVTPDKVVEQTEELKALDPYFLMRDHRNEDAALAAAIDFLRKL